MIRDSFKAFGMTSRLLTLVAVALITSTYFSRAQVSATIPYSNDIISTDSSGNIQNGSFYYMGFASSSRTGRFVAFASNATNLVSGDTNGKYDIFVKDRVSGSTVRANVDNSGNQISSSYWDTLESTISADGRYVVFRTNAPLSSNDTNIYADLYIRDLQDDTTTLVTETYTGGVGNGHVVEGLFSVNENGRFIVFSSVASNLVSGDTNGVEDVFVRDMWLGTTTLVSKGQGGTQSNGLSRGASISCEGSVIAFNSQASNLVSSDTNGNTDVFVVDRLSGDTITNITDGANSAASAGYTFTSCDGSSVGYRSGASNLVPGDTNAKVDFLCIGCFLV